LLLSWPRAGGVIGRLRGVPVELSPLVLRGALRELGARTPGTERIVQDVPNSIAGREEEHEPPVLSREVPQQRVRDSRST
jgi:hypothetical protein